MLLNLLTHSICFCFQLSTHGKLGKPSRYAKNCNCTPTLVVILGSIMLLFMRSDHICISSFSSFLCVLAQGKAKCGGEFSPLETEFPSASRVTDFPLFFGRLTHTKTKMEMKMKMKKRKVKASTAFLEEGHSNWASFSRPLFRSF